MVLWKRHIHRLKLKGRDSNDHLRGREAALGALQDADWRRDMNGMLELMEVDDEMVLGRTAVRCTDQRLRMRTGVTCALRGDRIRLAPICAASDEAPVRLW